MSDPRFEEPSGTVDGVNTTFSLVAPYVAGTLAPLLNGLVLNSTEFIETSPIAGTYDYATAPRVGDAVAAFYLAASDLVLTTPVLELQGVIVSSSIVGEVALSGASTGAIVAADVSGEVVTTALEGVTTSTGDLIGVIT